MSPADWVFAAGFLVCAGLAHLFYLGYSRRVQDLKEAYGWIDEIISALENSNEQEGDKEIDSLVTRLNRSED